MCSLNAPVHESLGTSPETCRWDRDISPGVRNDTYSLRGKTTMIVHCNHCIYFAEFQMTTCTVARTYCMNVSRNRKMWDWLFDCDIKHVMSTRKLSSHNFNQSVDRKLILFQGLIPYADNQARCYQFCLFFWRVTTTVLRISFLLIGQIIHLDHNIFLIRSSKFSPFFFVGLESIEQVDYALRARSGDIMD